MNKYHVTYFYHASGMDYPDTRDHGIVTADDEKAARFKIASAEYPKGGWERDWLMGALTAKRCG